MVFSSLGGSFSRRYFIFFCDSVFALVERKNRITDKLGSTITSKKGCKEPLMNMNGDMINLGRSDLCVAPLGVGAWSWGDTVFWGYGQGYGKSEVAAAF